MNLFYPSIGILLAYIWALLQIQAVTSSLQRIKLRKISVPTLPERFFFATNFVSNNLHQISRKILRNETKVSEKRIELANIYDFYYIGEIEIG